MRKKYGFLLKFLIKVLLIAAAGYLVWTYALCFTRASGNGMFPAVRDGDFCILYKLDTCHTGDVVCYQAPDGTFKLGRVAAVGGQSVDFPEEGGYLVNGYQPAEDITYQTYKAEGSAVQYPLNIGENEYFILGDYRDDTSDSRTYGAVKTDAVKGKVIFLLRRRGF